MSARTSTVWMVHALTGLKGVKGTLALSDRSLVFRPSSDLMGDSEFPLGSIRRARRIRGSPVLEVVMQRDASPAMIGFYFIEPPRLESEGRYLKKRKARTISLSLLRVANSEKRAEIEGWEQDLRQALHRSTT